MEYYSAIKKDEGMPFAATRIQLEIIIFIILSEMCQKGKGEYIFNCLEKREECRV